MKNIFFFLITLVLASCSYKSPETYKHLRGKAFGTTYSIIYENKLEKDFSKQIDNVIQQMNNSLSTYVATSDISKINKGDTTVVVDDFFEEVFQKSSKIYIETNGYFDPTVGALVNAWGFGPGKEIHDLDTLKVAEILKTIGFSKVSLVNHKIKKENEQIYFDFNAIAKGYGIDLIGRFLESQNCMNYMIELGGEIRARGVNSKDSVWKIGLEEPKTDGSRSISNIIALKDKAMATSGNYRKFKLDKSGKKYVHTINPITGFAYASNLLSVSVVADSDCADVDAYATSFMAMGYDKTMAFLKTKQNLLVHLIYVDTDGVIKTYTSEALLVANR